MQKSRKKVQILLGELLKERKRLLRRLSQGHELAIGTVSVVLRKCGNPGCRCVRGHRHPQTLFLFKDEEGRRRCKLVRRADEVRLQEAGELYRDFRRGLKRLRAIDRQEKLILMAHLKRRALRYE